MYDTICIGIYPKLDSPPNQLGSYPTRLFIYKFNGLNSFDLFLKAKFMIGNVLNFSNRTVQKLIEILIQLLEILLIIN